MLNKSFIKATVLYTLAVAIIFYLIWAVLDTAIPNAKLNMVGALSTAFGVNLPDNFFGQEMPPAAMFALGIISLLSIGLIILNVYFGAIVTSHFIRPRINLVIPTKGALSSKWNASMHYALIRMSNFHKADLVDVKISVVLAVEEHRGDEAFICYLPVFDYTPTRILVMAQKTPWTIAVPGDIFLSNTLTKDYHFKPGHLIARSFSSGKVFTRAKRTLEILIQGTDSSSYANFVIHRKILVDEQEGESYTLHLHRGSFKSLPLQISSPTELEQFAD